MKIIIAYASAGSGHFKAAEAVYDHLKECCSGTDIKIVDILWKTNFLFRGSYTCGYSFLIKFAPLAWLLGFLITGNKFLRPLTKPIAAFLNRFNTNDFSEFLIRENPEYVISTHFLPSEVAAALKKSGKINSKLITIITDFGVHPFWISSDADLYIVASEFTKEELKKLNIAQDKVKIFGIPIGEKFLRKYDRAELCAKFGIDKSKFTVLMMTGSFGIGPLEEIAEELCEEVQILVICANNKKLFIRLKNKNLANVNVFGFVDNAQELMAVSDVIITKPGGSTISEILAMELVPVFISAIPGQEAINVSALKRYGIGLSPKGIKGIKQAVLDFRDDPDKLNLIRENIRKIKKPDCVKEICGVVCKGSPGPAN
jgi:processive 1,2-diacylglycerol beta-glucosyltransferase